MHKKYFLLVVVEIKTLIKGWPVARAMEKGPKKAVVFRVDISFICGLSQPRRCLNRLLFGCNSKDYYIDNNI